jgi:hypothetical protein
MGDKGSLSRRVAWARRARGLIVVSFAVVLGAGSSAGAGAPPSVPMKLAAVLVLNEASEVAGSKKFMSVSENDMALSRLLDVQSAGRTRRLFKDLAKERRDELSVAIRDTRDAHVRLFYYSGHGRRIDGEDYLVPVDVDLGASADVKKDGIALSWVLQQYEAISGAGTHAINIIILDACRDDPDHSEPSAKPRRDTGWAGVPALPRNTMVLFATSPGKQVDDRPGRMTVFTEKLVEALAKQGSWTLPLELLFNLVAELVDKGRPPLKTATSPDHHPMPRAFRRRPPAHPFCLDPGACVTRPLLGWRPQTALRDTGIGIAGAGAVNLFASLALGVARFSLGSELANRTEEEIRLRDVDRTVFDAENDRIMRLHYATISLAVIGGTAAALGLGLYLGSRHRQEHARSLLLGAMVPGRVGGASIGGAF